jgi:two-component system sensor histidine kinase YesM
MLRKKFLISWLTLTIVIIFIISISVSYIINNIIDTLVINHTQEAFSLSASSIQDYFFKQTSQLLDICVDKDVQSELELYYKGEKIYEEVKPLLDQEAKYYSYGKLDIVPIRSGGAPYSDYVLDVGLKTFFESKTKDVKVRYLENNGQIQITKNIVSIDNWTDIIGIASATINLDSLNVFLNTLTFNDVGKLYLARDKSVILPFYATKKDPSSLYEKDTKEPYVSAQNELTFSSIIPNTNITLIGQVPMGELKSYRYTVVKLFLITSLFAIVGAMSLALFFSFKITNPILKLSTLMNNYNVDKNDNQIDTKTLSDEVLILANSYNRMDNIIHDLIDKVYVSKLNAQKAEFMALQAQINPHFLYNTLDSINWMAMKYGIEDIQLMTQSLATMLRRTLNNGNNLITIRNELEQITSYISIQRYRFQDLFEEFIIIDPKLMDYKIIKLILQPLVENAIIHGFSEEQEEKGKLFINGFIENDLIIFDVINTGKLIDLIKVNKILSSDFKNTKSYGIKNINARLIHEYGEKYPLQFFIKGSYSVARITIPLSKTSKGEQTC